MSKLGSSIDLYGNDENDFTSAVDPPKATAEEEEEVERQEEQSIPVSAADTIEVIKVSPVQATTATTPPKPIATSTSAPSALPFGTQQIQTYQENKYDDAPLHRMANAGGGVGGLHAVGERPIRPSEMKDEG
jgi:hypothetical protein